MLLDSLARASIRGLNLSDYDLQAAIDATPEGGELKLPAVECRLSRPVVANRSITIAGQGAGLTSFSGDFKEPKLRFLGVGPYRVVDLTVSHQGEQPGQVVWIDGSRCDFERCVISGGRWINEKGYGAGLHFSGASRGQVDFCDLTENDFGASLEDDAVVGFESNNININRIDGLRFGDRSHGKVIQNQCTHNLRSGISVRNQAFPELSGNGCKHNGEDGIVYVDQAEGLCLSNDCDYNGHNGIAVRGLANPRLVGNQCNVNQHNGMTFSGETVALARENRCGANLFHGLQIEDQARPCLQKNHSSENCASGIAFFGESGGQVLDHDLSLNEFYGIQVGDSAQPWIDDNSLRHNKMSGLAYFGRAGGLARKNRCTRNVYHGVQVAEEARPTLESNRAEHNGLAGIACLGQSQAAIRENECQFNQQSGIFVGDQAEPFLDQNRCIENSLNGLVYTGSGAGVSQKNRCESNGQYGIHIGPQASPILNDNHCQNNPVSDVVCLTETAVSVGAGRSFGTRKQVAVGFQVALETGDGQPFQLSLAFEPKPAERKVLESLARYSKMSEAQLAKATSTRRIGGLIESLVEKLQASGSACVVREGDGPDGAIYAFRR
jgi:parallel beta-helix repeat protein